MNIVRVIERRLGRLLGREASRQSEADKNSPAVAARLCQYGHTIFDGNNLCNYGHKPA
jgi:hypothetical protein